jgi:hypothetical protein
MDGPALQMQVMNLSKMSQEMKTDIVTLVDGVDRHSKTIDSLAADSSRALLKILTSVNMHGQKLDYLAEKALKTSGDIDDELKPALSRIEESVAASNVDFDGMDRKFTQFRIDFDKEADTLASKVDGLRTELKGKFETLDSKIEEKFDKMDKKFDALMDFLKANRHM